MRRDLLANAVQLILCRLPQRFASPEGIDLRHSLGYTLQHPQQALRAQPPPWTSLPYATLDPQPQQRRSKRN